MNVTERLVAIAVTPMWLASFVGWLAFALPALTCSPSETNRAVA